LDGTVRLARDGHGGWILTATMPRGGKLPPAAAGFAFSDPKELDPVAGLFLAWLDAAFWSDTTNVARDPVPEGEADKDQPSIQPRHGDED